MRWCGAKHERDKNDFINSKDFDSTENTLILKNLDSGNVDERIKDVKTF